MKSQASHGLALSALLRVDGGLRFARKLRRQSVLASTVSHRAVGVALLLGIAVLVYQTASAVLAGAAPAWMLLSVAVLGVACLLLLNLVLAERRSAGHRLRRVLDAAPVALLLVDPHGDIVLANAASRTLLGDGNALTGCPMASLLSGGTDSERIALARDGTQIPVEVAFTPMPFDGEGYVLAALGNLTERKARDAETIRQRDELAHLSRVKVLGELCGALAHELNQPLAAIMSNAQAAQRMLQLDSDPAEVRAALADIVESDRRAGDVIRRMRSWLRKDHEEFAPLDVNDVVVCSLRLLRVNLIGRGVDVHLDLGKRLPMVFGDRVQLQQVMVNLLMNACDAMDGLPAPHRLDVRTVAASGRVRICVEDEGTGIADAVRGRLFEPFETTKAQGMGMGLAVCRTIVEAHGGNIQASNNPACGATVWYDLPGMAT